METGYHRIGRRDGLCRRRCHGCARELNALLGAIAKTMTGPGRRRRLVFLGDMIDRGPDNIGTLKLWAEGAAARGVDRIDRLMGNHEQLLLLAMADLPHAPKAEAMWLSAAMGGDRFLREMLAQTSDPQARPSAALFAGALGDAVFNLFTTMRSHLVVGNVLFVHAGLDPDADPEEFLARPWTAFTEAQWAWIHGAFLEWRGGFKGRIVVHGHTPPHMHRELTGQEDPHLLVFDRLGLDGGTTRTGIVTGAQLEDGRYRILRAGIPESGETHSENEKRGRSNSLWRSGSVMRVIDEAIGDRIGELCRQPVCESFGQRIVAEGGGALPRDGRWVKTLGWNHSIKPPASAVPPPDRHRDLARGFICSCSSDLVFCISDANSR